MGVEVERFTLPSDQDRTGRSFDDAEIEAVTAVLQSGTLTGTKGNFTRRLEQRFAASLGVPHAYACGSGSAAIHAAVAAVDPEPGDEIITTPITDIGAVTPILYQAAIPVFADVDPKTCNVTAETIARVISPRTKAIIATHLFGNPCDMDEIVELARSRRIPLIEDAAQAFLATSGGRPVGAIGDIGCFSLQQGKHMTAGEGGLVTTTSEAFARRIRLFINKAWPYGEANPDHAFLALNYRMSELQAAVAGEQFEKLESMVAQRRKMAARLTARLSAAAGIEPPQVAADAEHSYWKYPLGVDATVIPGGPSELAAALRECGVESAPRYIQKPAFRCELFATQQTFGASRFPFTLARPEAVDYDRARFPGTYAGLERVLVLPINERYRDEHVDYLADVIVSRARELRQRGDR